MVHFFFGFIARAIRLSARLFWQNLLPGRKNRNFASLPAACLFVSSAISAAALVLPERCVAKEVISVVVLGDFSATGAVIDREVWDGLSLGFESLAPFDELFSIKLTTRDIKESAETAGTLATEQLGREGVDFVVALSQKAVEGAMKPTFAAGKILLAVTGSPASLLGKDCSKLFFSLAPPNDGTHELMALYLAQAKRSHTFLVASDLAENWDSLSAFRREFHGSISGEALIPSHRMNHSLDISKIRAGGSDSVYMILSGGLAVTFARQYADSGQMNKTPLFGSWSSFEPPYLMAIGDRALGAHSVGFWSNDLRNETNALFLSSFKAQYNRFPSSFAALGYDTALLVGTLASRLGSQIHNPAAVRTALRRYPVPSTRGDLRFATNHFPLTTFFLRRVDKDARGRYQNVIERVLVSDWRDSRLAACPMKWTPNRPQ